MLKAVVGASGTFSRRKAKWLSSSSGVLTPAFTANFMSGTLPSGLTFTRASNAMYYNSSGLLTQAANNNLRFDYNPQTLSLNGALVEQASTNLLIQSNFASGYTSTNVSLNGAATTSPDGTTNASSITDNSTSSSHFIQSGYISTSGTITQSIYAKAGTATVLQLAFQGSGSGYTNFNLANGTIGNSNAVSSTIQSLPNGWYRCTQTLNGTTGNYFYAALTNNSTTASGLPTYIGTGQSLYVYGGQLEAQSFATSYIPTTSAAATRAQDVLYTSNVTWLNATAGTFICKSIYTQFSSGPAVLSGSGNTGLNTNGSLHTQWYNGSSNVAVSNTLTALSLMQEGFSYTASSRNVCLNGGAIVSDANVPWGTLPTVFYLGMNSGGSQYLNGWLQSMAYYSTTITGSTLQGLL